MKKTMLWGAFAALSKSEIREVGRFVASPFFNRKPQLVRLFDYLCKCRDRQCDPEETEAHQAAFPEAAHPFDDAKLRLANSDLLALLEEFWAIQEFRADRVTVANRVSIAYRKRQLEKHAQIARRNAERALENQPLRHADYLALSHAQLLEAYHAASATKRYEAFKLQELSDVLDQGFIAQKLRHTCMVLSHSAVVKKQYDLGMFEAAMAQVESRQLLHVPAIALYYHACRFLTDLAGSEVWFVQFVAQLQANGPLFPPEEERDLYLIAINFGIKQSNAHGQPWYTETFGLYKIALDKGLLLEQGVLSRFAYSNIVSIAMRIGQTDWAETFVQAHRNSLERRYREATFSLNAARVAFGKKDYDAVLLYLQKADYKDFINAMNAKVLQMKVYFESNEHDLLDSHLDSMNNFIRRQRAVGYHRENYLNIVRYTRALARALPHERAVILQQIRTEKVLTEKNWFLTMNDEA